MISNINLEIAAMKRLRCICFFLLDAGRAYVIHQLLQIRCVYIIDELKFRHESSDDVFVL